MNRYETHCHTAESSACASAPGAVQADFYKSRGFKGIIVTDHFLNGNTRADRHTPWEQQVDIMFLGYENAKKRGEEIGLDVFFGWEYTIEGSDFLTYGLDKEWLLAHPETVTIPPNEYFDLVRSAGAYVSHAHPFREDWYIDMIRLLPRKCDAVEIINSCRKPFENEMAKVYADSYGLPYTAGSDNHHANQARLSGIETEETIRDIQHFIEVLRSGNYRIFDEVKE